MPYLCDQQLPRSRWELAYTCAEIVARELMATPGMSCSRWPPCRPAGWITDLIMGRRKARTLLRAFSLLFICLKAAVGAPREVGGGRPRVRSLALMTQRKSQGKSLLP